MLKAYHYMDGRLYCLRDFPVNKARIARLSAAAPHHLVFALCTVDFSQL